MESDPQILVTGASGFLGGYVVKLFATRGYSRVRCLVRSGSRTEEIQNAGFQIWEGDLGDKESLGRAMKGCSGLFNLASLGFGHAPNIVGACQEAGVQRAIFVSTTAIYTTLDAATKGIRLEAESLIAQSDIDYTILRPTMIYGSRDDRNIARLIRYLQRYPLIPIFGTGELLQQPVHVTDVAAAVLDAFESPKTLRRAYNISGAEPLSYNQVIDTVCHVLGRRVLKLRIPLRISVLFLTLCNKIFPTKLTPEQLLRLNEDKAFSYEEAARDFDFAPLAFAEGVRREIEHDFSTSSPKL
jgi:uncharacterized protein YbjT (DUF2867 family)